MVKAQGETRKKALPSPPILASSCAFTKKPAEKQDKEDLHLHDSGKMGVGKRAAKATTEDQMQSKPGKTYPWTGVYERGSCDVHPSVRVLVFSLFRYFQTLNSLFLTLGLKGRCFSLSRMLLLLLPRFFLVVVLFMCQAKGSRCLLSLFVLLPLLLHQVLTHRALLAPPPSTTTQPTAFTPSSPPHSPSPSPPLLALPSS